MQDSRQGDVSIGVSFPDYKEGDKKSPLGSRCRLFAKGETTLTQFDAAKWLSRLSDYVHCTRIRPVPEKVTGYAIYQRLQPKTNKERLARRYAKRHNMDVETALNSTIQLDDKSQFRYCDMPQKKIVTPFIRLQSLSSDQVFCLWIKKTVMAEPSGTYFSCYGLSAKTTVPEF